MRGHPGQLILDLCEVHASHPAPEDLIPEGWSRVPTGEIPAFGDQYWIDDRFLGLSVVAIAAKIPVAKDEFVIRHPDRFKVLSRYKIDLPRYANHCLPKHGRCRVTGRSGRGWRWTSPENHRQTRRS